MNVGVIAFEELVGKLGDADKDVRVGAIKEIMKIKERRGEALRELVGLMEDPEYQVCKAAIEALGKLKDTRAVPDVVRVVEGHVHGRVRVLALKALLRIDGEVAKPYVRAAVGDESVLVRSAVGKMVEQSKARELVHVLFSLAKDESATVRESAVRAIGKLGEGSMVVDVLMEALGDAEKVVRSEAIKGLGEKGDTRAVEPLMGMLMEANGNGRKFWASEYEWKEILRALGKLGDPSVVMPLLVLLVDEKTLLGKGDIAMTLGELGDKRAVGPLVHALGTVVWQDRVGVIEALGKLGDVRAVEALLGVVENKKLYGRVEAMRVLGELGDRRALGPLIEVLKDKEEEAEVLVQAMETLVDLGVGMEALDPLIELAEHTGPYVKATAEWAAKEIINGDNWEEEE